MKMKKVFAVITVVMMVCAMLAGCGDAGKNTSSAAKTNVNVYAIKGPTGIGMVNLMEENANGNSSNNYTFTAVSSPDDVVSKITNGEADIAAVPTNLAASLYAKTNGNVQMLAVNTLGVLYIMENGSTIQSAADLKGKTIYSTGQGANPEYILEYLLKQNGIDPEKDVTIVYKSENDELASLLISGTAQVALVPEPVVTTVMSKNSSLRVALDMTSLWNTASGGSSKLMMGCVIARKEFVDSNANAVNAFLKEYKASIEKASSDIGTTASLCEKYEIIASSAIAQSAIPRCSLTYVDGNDMMKQIKGYFDVLYAANPKSVGGALPGDTFYYNAAV